MTNYCTRSRGDFEAQYAAGTCGGPAGCGHLIIAHIGVDHCAMCELLDLVTKQRELYEAVAAEAIQAGAQSVNAHRADLGLPRPQDINVHVHVDGRSLFEQLRDQLRRNPPTDL